MSEVERNLKSSSQTSAPGCSGISLRALRWALEVAPEVIHYIVHWSIKLGFHHPDWKSVVMVVLPKLHKPDYASPRAYCPIQLLECPGKLVEKIVARRLMFDCAKYSLMPPEQFGGVMAASCIDVGLSLTHNIESALLRGHTASLLSVDVKGFFDSVNHCQLVHTLRSMGFSPSILQWTASFLNMNNRWCDGGRLAIRDSCCYCVLHLCLGVQTDLSWQDAGQDVLRPLVSNSNNPKKIPPNTR